MTLLGAIEFLAIALLIPGAVFALFISCTVSALYIAAFVMCALDACGIRNPMGDWE